MEKYIWSQYSIASLPANVNFSIGIDLTQLFFFYAKTPLSLYFFQDLYILVRDIL